jgi:hypothetical protein
MTRPVLHILTLLLMGATARAAEPHPRLIPGLPMPMTEPYAVAALRMTNKASHEAVAVRTRWRGGGPTLLHNAALAPGQTADIPVILPPIAPTQHYDIELLAPGGKVLLTTTAEINWPDDAVRREAFLDPAAYATPAAEDYPAWPGRLKRLALLGAGIYAVLLTATVLIPKPQIRGIALVVVVIGGCVALTWQARPVVVEDPLEDGVVLRTLRTAKLSLPSPPRGILTPVYRSPAQMQRETLAIHPGRGGAMILSPSDVRIFRTPAPAPRGDQPRSSESSSSSPSP